MCDLFIPDKGCTTISIDWLHGVEILVVYEEDAYTELVQINELEDTVDSIWYHNNGTALKLERDGLPYFVVVFSIASVRVVIHECVHLVDFIFTEKGIPITVDNTEVRAYMVDYLCMKLFHILEIDLPEPFTLDPSQWVEVDSTQIVGFREVVIAPEEVPEGCCVVGNEL